MDMGVSKNQRPQYRPQHTRVVICKDAHEKNPNIWKQPHAYMSQQVEIGMS